MKSYIKLVIVLLVFIIALNCASCQKRELDNGMEYYSSSNYYGVTDITFEAGKHIEIPTEHDGHCVTYLSDRNSGLFELPAIYKTLILPETMEIISSSFYYNASKSLQYNEYDNGLYLGTKDNPYFAFIKVKDVESAALMSNIIDGGVDDPIKEGLPPPAYIENPTDASSCVIHPDTKIIANNAFAGCKNLKSITIPGTIKVIPSVAFGGCRSLETVIIEEGVEIIQGGAFLDCTNLVSIVFPSTLKEAKNIFDTADGNTYGFEAILSDGLQAIPEGMFAGCNYLRSVSIPDSVKMIGEEAFYNCFALESVSLPSSLENINRGVFYGCEALSEITIPNSVKEIGEQAFYGCKSLSKIDIPESVTNIGKEAFYGCESLSEINIPDSLTKIEDRTFAFCSSLTSLYIPDTIKSIGSNAFVNCSSIKSIIMPPIFNIDCSSTAFWGASLSHFEIDYTDVETVTVDGNIYNKDMTALIKYNGEDETSFTVPDSVIYICDKAFMNSNITEIILPETLEKIGMMAFYNCDGLTSFETPKQLSYLGDWCFTDCDSLEIIRFDCKISSYSYSGIVDSCDALKTVQFSGNLDTIGTYMFKKLTSLEKIEIPESIPHGKCYTRNGVLYTYTSYEILTFYPRGKKDKVFYLDDTTRYISSQAFKDNQYLEEVYISGSVDTMYEQVFENCQSLKKVTFLGDGLRVIGESAFKNCISLKEIVASDRVSSIGGSAFEGCISLETVILGDRVGWICENAFRNCTSLKNVVFGELAYEIYIYEGAFIGCYQLEKMVIPENIGKIMGIAFEEQVEIHFKGNKSQWEGEESWWGDVKNGDNGGYYVHCKNGTLWVNR